jgi:hypothetical protein
MYVCRLLFSSLHLGRLCTSPSLLTKQHSSRHESTNLGVNGGAVQITVGCYQTCKCESKSLLVEVNKIAPETMFSEKTVINICEAVWRRSPWSRCLKRGSVTTRLLGLWVRVPPGEWMPVACEPLNRRGGVIPCVVCLRTILKPRQNGALDPLGLSSHEEKYEKKTSWHEG